MCFVTAAFNDVLAHAHKLRLLYRHRKEEPHAQDRTVLETMRLARILPFGPHFTTQEHAQQRRTCAVGLAAIKRPRTRETPFRPAEHNTPRARGFPWYTGRAPRKLGWWGAKREKIARKLTSSALSLPQFTQIHSKIFLTFTKNPKTDGWL